MSPEFPKQEAAPNPEDVSSKLLFEQIFGSEVFFQHLFSIAEKLNKRGSKDEYGFAIIKHPEAQKIMITAIAEGSHSVDPEMAARVAIKSSPGATFGDVPEIRLGAVIADAQEAMAQELDLKEHESSTIIPVLAKVHFHPGTGQLPLIPSKTDIEAAREARSDILMRQVAPKDIPGIEIVCERTSHGGIKMFLFREPLHIDFDQQTEMFEELTDSLSETQDEESMRALLEQYGYVVDIVEIESQNNTLSEEDARRLSQKFAFIPKDSNWSRQVDDTEAFTIE